jgi:next-to-BRCA1 protein 1
VHPSDHLMLKVITPVTSSRTSAASAVEHPASCNLCYRKICNVRYKCLTCDDFDLCEACETSSVPQHPRTHPMLKIKIPRPVSIGVNDLTASLRGMYF